MQNQNEAYDNTVSFKKKKKNWYAFFVFVDRSLSSFFP